MLNDVDRVRNGNFVPSKICMVVCLKWATRESQRDHFIAVA